MNTGPWYMYKIHLFYYIQVGYSGQSDIVARKGWPKVATISEVHCISQTAEIRGSVEV